MEYLAKTKDFETVLGRLNETLHAEFGSDAAPRTDLATIQIVGLPRSGTTVLYQLLARTFQFGYPSNLMAFFWQTPHIGAILQKRLSMSDSTIELRSLAGRTQEPLGPHEFGYFWRSSLGHSQNCITPDGPAKSAKELENTLNLVNSAFGKPTVYKNLLATSHVALFGTEMTNQYFLHIKREPIDVAASLLLIRDQLRLPVGEWFGTIPAPEKIQFESDVEQVAHQVLSLMSANKEATIESHPMCLTIDYLDLCTRPREMIYKAASFTGTKLSNSDLERLPEQMKPSAPLEQLDTGRRAALHKLLT